MATYTYTKTGAILSRLVREIISSSISSSTLADPPVEDSGALTNNLTINFVGVLSGPDESALGTVVTNHPVASSATPVTGDPVQIGSTVSGDLSGTMPSPTVAKVNGVTPGSASGVATLNASSLVVQNPNSATATPTATSIPISDGSGKLVAGWGGNANTLATLDGSSLVVQNPANATATPTASKIPIADGSGKLVAGWGGNASTLATLNASTKVVQDPANAQTTASANKIPLGDGTTGQLDSSWGGKASGLATLSASSLVVQNPANATATPTANKIVISDVSGLVDGWVSTNAVAATPSLRKLGTGATDACAGNDSRLSDARTPTGSASGDLTGTYPGPTIASAAVTGTKIASATITGSNIASTTITATNIANSTITDTQVAAANKDGTTSTPSMRTLGTGALQACAGNDSRLSDSRTPTGAASGDLAGTYPSPTVAQASQTFALTGTITPTTLGADTNDYAPTGLSTASIIRISSSLAVNLTGLTGGAAGRLIVLENIGSFSITLVTESASSTASNRFSFSRDLILSANASCTLHYDGSSSRWRMVGAARDPVFVGATAGTSGTIGPVPAPAAGAQNFFLRGDSTWASAGAATSIFKQSASTVATTTPTTAATTWPVSGTAQDLLTLSLTTQASAVILIRFHTSCSNSSNNTTNFFRVLVDGSPVTQSYCAIRCGTANQPYATGVFLRVTGLSAASHTVIVQWRVGGGTARVDATNNTTTGEQASLVVEEVSA